MTDQPQSQPQPLRAVVTRLQLEIFVPYPPALAERLLADKAAIDAKIAEMPEYARPLIVRHYDNHPGIADFIKTRDYTAIRAEFARKAKKLDCHFSTELFRVSIDYSNPAGLRLWADAEGVAGK